jgi:N-acetylneuraminic acid mutarotase
VLGSGQVLVIGGYAGASGASLASCELYDPATDRWTTTGSMAAARVSFGVAVTTSGRVLAVGGATNNSSTDAACELYDPLTGSWTATGSLTAARNSHSVVALPGGRVLAIAGNGATQGLASAELWEPSTGTWSAAGALPVARTGQAAAALIDGRVLVCGGLAAPLRPHHRQLDGHGRHAHGAPQLHPHDAARRPLARRRRRPQRQLHHRLARPRGV